MHHLFGCWLSCTLIWWGNNVKHRFIHIYKRLAVCKRSILFLDWADTPAPARHAGRQDRGFAPPPTATDVCEESMDGRLWTEPWHGRMAPSHAAAPEGWRKGSVAVSQKKTLTLRCFAVFQTRRATRRRFRWCAASLPISSSFKMKGNLPILETDKGLKALQTLAPQLFWTW